MAVRRSTLGVATGLLVLSLGSAWAADDGYQDVFSSVATAVGLLKADETPDIDYRERAPLVLPPKMDLVAPAATASHPASWPQDPDVVRRNRAAADSRAPVPVGKGPDVLSRAELMKGRVDDRPVSAQRAADCGNNGNRRNCLVLSPDQLRAESAHYQENNPDAQKAELQPGQEPEREYLTQPPKGYLKLTKATKAGPAAIKAYHDESNPNAALVYKPKNDDE
jgi:hypothetical protein